MKTITIEVIAEPSITKVNNSKGGYRSLEVPFKDNGKVSGKKINDIYQKDIFDSVASFKRGDRVEVGLEKEEGSDGREYWQWRQVRKLDAGTSADASPAQGGVSTDVGSGPVNDRETSAVPAKGRVTGSNYETPEERALKQVLIVRQSSIEQANKYLSSVGAVYTLPILLENAERIAEWVFEDGVLLPPALIPQVVKTERQEQAQAQVIKKRGRPAAKAVEEIEEDLPF